MAGGFERVTRAGGASPAPTTEKFNCRGGCQQSQMDSSHKKGKGPRLKPILDAWALSAGLKSSFPLLKQGAPSYAKASEGRATELLCWDRRPLRSAPLKQRVPS